MGANRRELILLGAAIVLGLAVRIIYVIATRHYALAGDAPEYDAEGELIAHGHLFWTSLPYGILHAGAWKARLSGVGRLLVRPDRPPSAGAALHSGSARGGHDRADLAARPALFGTRVAVAAAFVVALYPLAWQFEEMLYPSRSPRR